MEKFFTYELMDADGNIRIGKGHTVSQSSNEVIRYLRSRYGAQGWDSADVAWHASEAAALKHERRAIDEHIEISGSLASSPTRAQRRRRLGARCVARASGLSDLPPPSGASGARRLCR